MRIMSNLKWEPGLVAFIKEAERLSACIRTPDDRYNLIFSEGVFISHDCAWRVTSGLWDDDPVLWVGTQSEWDTLRALSKSPAELIENAVALTAGKQATQANDDATILDFLESCGISAPDLEEARKIVIHTLDETRELRAKLGQAREAHKQCSDALRSANKRADDAESRIAQVRSILGPNDPIVAGGFYRDGAGALWYVPRCRSEACGEERWFHQMPDTSDWRFVAQGAEDLSWLGSVHDEAARLKLSWRV